jgi:hypothetical protein
MPIHAWATVFAGAFLRHQVVCVMKSWVWEQWNRTRCTFCPARFVPVSTQPVKTNRFSRPKNFTMAAENVNKNIRKEKLTL